MATTPTDNKQELLMGGTYYNDRVNAATGELRLIDKDLGYSVAGSNLSLNVTRTYRSFYNHIEDFGYGWTFVPRSEYYAAPIENQGLVGEDFKFIFSGEGRVLFAPINNTPGIFWAANDPHTPNVAASKLMVGSTNSSYEKFDFSGRLLSRNDFQGARTRTAYYVYSGNQLVMMMDQDAVTKNSQGTLRKVLKSFQKICPVPRRLRPQLLHFWHWGEYLGGNV
jgi:hypothetical protein